MDDVRDMKEKLLLKLRNRDAVVGVVGLGYVGLPLAVEVARAGFRVLGIERNPKRVDLVNAGKSYIDDVSTEELEEFVQSGRLKARADFARVPEMDAIVIAVPTPLTRNLVPDLQYVEGVTRELSLRLRPGQLVSLESTTYPGTTEEVMLPILESGSGLRVEEDFFLAYSPERVDPGNKNFNTKNTSKVVGGVGPASLEVASALYSQVIEHVVPVASAKAAELVKVYENTFRAVNIALVNELALLCDRMGLNVWEVLDAAFTKPFGIMPFYPGPGVGGHCIPIDPHYLEWKAKEFNFNTHFIALAGEINRKMPEFVLEKVRRILNDIRIAPSASRILLLGVAYKKDASDLRESPALDVLRLLMQEGAQVAYHDPFVPELSWEGISLRNVPLTAEVLHEQDLVVLTTDHTHVDYEFVRKNARKILDTRGVYRRSLSENIVLL